MYDREGEREREKAEVCEREVEEKKKGGIERERGLVTLRQTEGRSKPRSFEVAAVQTEMIPSPGTADGEGKVLGGES